MAISRKSPAWVRKITLAIRLIPVLGCGLLAHIKHSKGCSDLLSNVLTHLGDSCIMHSHSSGELLPQLLTHLLKSPLKHRGQCI